MNNTTGFYPEHDLFCVRSDPEIVQLPRAAYLSARNRATPGNAYTPAETFCTTSPVSTYKA